ncbi:hypothetical protein Bbelb_071980 [Branchiostoma belcheri]|nr:hypothetical protein Bbelb_071980 [Branchiostoma belcheri]
MFSFSKLKRLLVLLLVMKESEAATTCTITCSYASCDCSDRGLRSVPQDLPSTITYLWLRRNVIVSLTQSDFSGNETVESGGRVTVEANGTIIIQDIAAVDSGLYVCLAASPVGSTSAQLSIHVQGPSSGRPLTQGTEALSGEHIEIYENDDQADLTVDSVYENDNGVEQVGAVSAHLYENGNEDGPVNTVSGLQLNMYENDHEVEEGGTAPVNVYENDNEVEEGGTAPVNVYENDNEVEEGGTAPVNVYENDNEVEEGGTAPVNVYENDNEVEEGGTAPVNVYENDNEVEEGGTAPVNVYGNDHEVKEGGTAPVNVYENDHEVKEGGTAPVNVYENDHEVEEGGTAPVNVYENDNEVVSPDPVSELHGNVYENDDEDAASIHSSELCKALVPIAPVPVGDVAPVSLGRALEPGKHRLLWSQLKVFFSGILSPLLVGLRQAPGSYGHNPPYVLLRALSTYKNVFKRRASVRSEYRLRTESYGFGSTQPRRRTLSACKTFSTCGLRIHHPCVRVRATRVPRTCRAEEARSSYVVSTYNSLTTCATYDARNRSRPDVACRPHSYTLRNRASDVRRRHSFPTFSEKR